MAKSPARSTHASRTSLAPYGPPPILEGEDPSAYDELLAQISGTVKPADMLEEIWVSDIVNLTWEISQLRRLKTMLITASTHLGVRTALGPMQLEFNEAYDLSRDWAAGVPRSIETVKELLASAGISMDAVMALTIAAKITDIERFERMIMNAEMRRNAALREIERHRANFGKTLRQASEALIDAQCEQVDTPQINDREAA